jgi:hypothetical protein
MKILDLSAGNRAIWYDRDNPLATFVDVRAEVNPTHVADSRALPPEVGDGDQLVVFDPPHKNNGANGAMVRSYGHHTAAEIAEIIRNTAREAHRVTADDAFMAFKWNNHSRKLETALELLHPWWLPLFGHGMRHQQRTGSQTYWVLLRRAP